MVQEKPMLVAESAHLHEQAQVLGQNFLVQVVQLAQEGPPTHIKHEDYDTSVIKKDNLQAKVDQVQELLILESEGK